MNSVAEFLQRVEVADSGCWNWQGYVDPQLGYGGCSWRGKQNRAHRVSYSLFVGNIPLGAHILHHCDNRRCVNPAHLYAGTNNDNIRDRVARNRSPKGDKHWTHQHPEKVVRGPGSKPSCAKPGEKSPSAKLTAPAVIEIRRLHDDGWRGCDLAERFGVSRATVCNITKRVTWRHI